MFSVTISKYGSRHYAVYLNGRLLAVTVYKKGAKTVADTISALLLTNPVPSAHLHAI